jgi:hypothetical protein
MDEAARHGVVFVIEEVARELERKDEGAYKWVREHASIIVMIDPDIQKELTDIMAKYGRLVDNRRHRSGCDPWVIALARSRAMTVVTGERASGSLEKPKIPDVCRELGLPCLGIVDFFREQGWRL